MVYFTAWTVFLTLFASCLELLRNSPTLERKNDPKKSMTPSQKLGSRWQGSFNQLFQSLKDEPAWQLMAALQAVSTDSDDEQTL
ncbi:hypothetical protein MJO28_011501, partial [Puccinia striiformis f. sp. tritici]